MMQKKKWLLPPWLAYPELERCSIGWRMGSGESYMMKWGDWYDGLAAIEQAEYQQLFPEPVVWKGFWEEEEECPYYEKGEFFMELWREGGTPRYSLEQVRQECREGNGKPCFLFWGHQPDPDGQITKSCLSQWWMAEFQAVGQRYCCMEQYMMAMKAELFDDPEVLQQILECRDPKRIKALGRRVKNFDQTVWNDVKYAIVLNGNYKKFSQNPELRTFLLGTGDSVIAEASPFDGIWGIRMSPNHEDAQDPLKWRGKNLLGFALMEVREELAKLYQNEALCVTEI